jgi:hypothetical protein
MHRRNYRRLGTTSSERTWDGGKMLCRISQYSRARGTSGVPPSASVILSAVRWHFLYFLPLPHQHRALRPGLFFAMATSDLRVPHQRYRKMGKRRVDPTGFGRMVHAPPQFAGGASSDTALTPLASYQRRDIRQVGHPAVPLRGGNDIRAVARRSRVSVRPSCLLPRSVPCRP